MILLSGSWLLLDNLFFLLRLIILLIFLAFLLGCLGDFLLLQLDLLGLLLSLPLLVHLPLLIQFLLLLFSLNKLLLESLESFSYNY